MTKATLKRIERVSFGDYAAPIRKVWVINFEDGSEFDEYKTKKAALEDAKKYEIKIH